MIWVKVFFGAVGIIIVGWLALAIVLFNVKRIRIIRAAAAATNDQLEEIYQLIEAGSSEKVNGFVLGRLNKAADDVSWVVAIPSELEKFPWAGKCIAVDVDTDVRFRFLDSSHQTTQLLGRQYRPIAVPRVRLKSGKLRNQFSPSQYVKRNEHLREKLRRICPKYPTDLLSYLLCTGQETFGFEPMNQGRIGTTAEWVQGQENQYCDHCKQRMTLILQVPGSLLPKKSFEDGTVYLFGCRKHTDQTRTVVQFT